MLNAVPKAAKLLNTARIIVDVLIDLLSSKSKESIRAIVPFGEEGVWLSV
jgi:hypothetical protein